MIYWRKQYQVKDLVLSGIRSNEPLHTTRRRPEIEACAEISIKHEGEWHDLWVGHPGECHQVLKAVTVLARQTMLAGGDNEEIFDFLMDLPVHNTDLITELAISWLS